MSWDVMIFNSEEPPPLNGEVPSDFTSISLGDADEVRARISKSLPEVDWSDPAWGQLIHSDFIIEFNFQADGDVEGFLLHVRGGGNPLIPICKVCSENGWYPLDTSTGLFINVDDPSYQGWEGFQQYRDRVIGSTDG
jgi:hypothetical protein